jgi:pre-60S factor REI1
MATPKAPGVTVIETHKATTATCMTCRLTFASLDDQREHYKTDLHKFNLKRKVAELPPVTAQQFEEKAKRIFSFFLHLVHAKETAVQESEPVLFNCSTCK